MIGYKCIVAAALALVGNAYPVAQRTAAARRVPDNLAVAYRQRAVGFEVEVSIRPGVEAHFPESPRIAPGTDSCERNVVAGMEFERVDELVGPGGTFSCSLLCTCRNARDCEQDKQQPL